MGTKYFIGGKDLSNPASWKYADIHESWSAIPEPLQPHLFKNPTVYHSWFAAIHAGESRESAVIAVAVALAEQNDRMLIEAVKRRVMESIAFPPMIATRWQEIDNAARIANHVIEKAKAFDAEGADQPVILEARAEK